LCGGEFGWKWRLFNQCDAAIWILGAQRIENTPGDIALV
jgi:hypothetical protein